MMNTMIFACPICHGPLEVTADNQLTCRLDGQLFDCVEGIWRFLPAERHRFYAQFLDDYAAIRHAEGRGSDEPAYYRALPFVDLSGRHSAAWKIRAASYTVLLKRVLEPMGQKQKRPLTILDLGAGNGWLSYRLSLRGHQVAAVDLLTDKLDGLGAHMQYDRAFTPVQAAFDQLPFPNGTADLAIYNASFHYSLDYRQTLAEARRVLVAGGRAVVVDTPVYQLEVSGRQMVAEREAQFRRDFGRAGNALPIENYLTHEQLAQLARTEGLNWQMIWPIPSWRRRLRQWRRQLSGGREAAQFPLLLAQWGR